MLQLYIYAFVANIYESAHGFVYKQSNLFWSYSALIGGQSSGTLRYVLQIQIPTTIGAVLQKKGPARCLPCVPQKCFRRQLSTLCNFDLSLDYQTSVDLWSDIIAMNHPSPYVPRLLLALFVIEKRQ